MTKLINRKGQYLKREVVARNGRTNSKPKTKIPPSRDALFFTAPMDERGYVDLRAARKQREAAKPKR